MYSISFNLLLQTNEQVDRHMDAPIHSLMYALHLYQPQLPNP